MENSELLNRLKQAMIDGEEEETIDLVRKSLEMNISANTIIDQGLSPGIREIGDLFEEGEYFLPELMQGAEIMKEAMRILDPVIAGEIEPSSNKGKVVIGTVQGDIHDIGKTLVASMLTASGYEVFDLGAEVSHDSFIAAIREKNADVLCLSALLTTTMTNQKLVIDLLEKEGMRDNIKVLVGGAPVSASWADEIGADGYADNAVDAVKLVDRLLGS